MRGLFPHTSDRLKLMAITLAASCISISELGIAKVFTEVIFQIDTSKHFPYLLMVLFVGFSVTARIAHYFQRVKRITVLDKIIRNSQLKNAENSWNLSLAIEVANILGCAFQILIITIFLATLSIYFGLLIFGCIVIAGFVLSQLYGKQEIFQRNVFQSQYRKQKVLVGARTLVRVRGGEIGSLVTGTIMVGTLIALIAFHHQGWVKTSDAVISFFAVRMIGTNLNSLATGLMRHARALVNSSLSTARVTKNSPPDGSVTLWENSSPYSQTEN